MASYQIATGRSHCESCRSLGMVGQGIRVVIETNTLALSLLIGFIAGALAMVGVSSSIQINNPSKELIITIIGAGYAGTDFIEGFIKKNMPATPAGAQAGAKDDEIEHQRWGKLWTLRSSIKSISGFSPSLRNVARIS